MAGVVVESALINLPSGSLFSDTDVWLSHLSTTYEEYKQQAQDPHLFQMIHSISNKIQEARVTTKKTQFAMQQYTLLDDRVTLLENRTSRQSQYNSAWNQLQVYKGLRAVYSKCLMKLSVQMVELSLSVDDSHEQFSELMIVDDDECWNIYICNLNTAMCDFTIFLSLWWHYFQ